MGRKERRKLVAREGGRGVWYGLGMFGLVGWSIATPTVLATAFGVWLDRKWPQTFSFTLICLFCGAAFGCAIAWYWVKREGLDEDFAAETPDSPGEPKEPNNDAT